MMQLSYIGLFVTMATFVSSRNIPRGACNFLVMSESSSDYGAVARVSCMSGSLDWQNAQGQLTLVVKPTIVPSGVPQFRTCLTIQTAHIELTVNGEQHDSDSLKPVCTDLVNGQSTFDLKYTPLTEDSHVTFHYDVITPAQEGAIVNSEQTECRPCSDEQLLIAYCSSSYVLSATIESTSTSSNSLYSTIEVTPTRVHREPRNGVQFTTSNTGVLFSSCAPNMRPNTQHVLFADEILGRPVVTCSASASHFEAVVERSAGSALCEINL